MGGLCQARPSDVANHSSENLWNGVYPRMMVAPQNEMSESYGGQAPEEEARRREMRRMALFYEILRRNRVLSDLDSDPYDIFEDSDSSDDEIDDDEELPAAPSGNDDDRAASGS